jgi:hypothetical protein
MEWPGRALPDTAALVGTINLACHYAHAGLSPSRKIWSGAGERIRIYRSEKLDPRRGRFRIRPGFNVCTFREVEFAADKLGGQTTSARRTISELRIDAEYAPGPSSVR